MTHTEKAIELAKLNNWAITPKMIAAIVVFIQQQELQVAQMIKETYNG